MKKVVEKKEEKGLRYNLDKPQWSLVDFKSFEGMVRVLEHGTKKYSRNNWKQGLSVVQTSESLLRHVFAFLNGENIDLESGLSHVSHIQCNAMFLDYILREKKEFDDRDINNIKKGK
jgi:hypothetical protein